MTSHVNKTNNISPEDIKIIDQEEEDSNLTQNISNHIKDKAIKKKNKLILLILIIIYFFY